MTIDSRSCNLAKFNQLYDILDDHTKKLKNTISLYCLNSLTRLVTNYTQFKKNYVLFENPYLNSWEKQNLFQEVSSHYYETATRYLNKATYIIQKQAFLSRNNKINRVKSKLNSLAALIDNNSNLVYDQNYVLIKHYSVYSLDFDTKDKLKSLNNYLTNYKKDLTIAHNLVQIKSTDNEFYSNDPLIKAIHQEIVRKTNIEIIKLENLIISYNKIITVYLDVEQFALTKPTIYNRIINLVKSKKLRLLFLANKNVNINTQNSKALINASSKGDFDMVDLLIDYGSNIHAQNGASLIEASINNHLMVTKLLLENGANPDSQNSRALRLASDKGFVEVVKILLDYNASPASQENQSILWVHNKGHHDVVYLSHSYGVNLNNGLKDKCKYNFKQSINSLKERHKLKFNAMTDVSKNILLKPLSISSLISVNIIPPIDKNKPIY